MKVVKRDGTIVEFDKKKIKNAIVKAFIDVDGEETSVAKAKAAEIARYIESECNQRKDNLSVETIQDLVVGKLMSSSRKDVATKYVEYRYKRQLIRESNTTDQTIMELLNGTSEYWNTENSNKDAKVVTTQRDYIAGIASTDITRRFLLPKDIVDAHDKGIIHFHDADYFAQNALHNCDLINLDDMLQNGTVISGTLIEKPHSFSTACNIATQIIAQVASSQYGGQSVDMAALAPFVDISRQKIRKEVEEEARYFAKGVQAYSETDIDTVVEKRVKDEIKRGIQTIQYQVVTLMTTNGQTPFITVFLNVNGGKNKRERDDLALLIEETLNQRYEGTKNEQGVWVSPTFPKLIYVLDENNAYEGTEYWYLTKLAAKCSAKRLVPDYISAKIMRELKSGDVYTCMGCRSFLTVDRFTEAGLGNIAKAKNYEPNKHKYYGRFNQGVVTLNLPYVALGSEKDIEKFWQLLDEYAELCHRALRLRHERLLNTKSDVAPILWQYGALARLDKGETINNLLYNGYSTISLGYAGLYECVKYLTGHSHSDEDIGEAFGIKVMQFLNDKCAKWKKEENIDYSLYGTPLESSTYKFAKALKRDFGNVEGITDRNYVTNSYHIPVFEEIDPFEKLRIEAKFQRLSPGGSISYIETSNLTDNVDAVLEVMQFIYENIMYAELNTKSDYCQVCGYDGEIELIDEGGKLIWKCPQCGNTDTHKMNVTRRTCGYLGTASNGWNQGRLGDIHDRYVHLDDHEYKDGVSE